MAKKQNSKIAAAVAPPESAAPVTAPVEEPTESVRHFLKPEDWVAGLVMGLLSGLAFFYYMAPEVTLQDSCNFVPDPSCFDNTCYHRGEIGQEDGVNMDHRRNN